MLKHSLQSINIFLFRPTKQINNKDGILGMFIISIFRKYGNNKLLLYENNNTFCVNNQIIFGPRKCCYENVHLQRSMQNKRYFHQKQLN